MPYDSTVSFTLDTICPWTYLAYRRLTTALTKYADANPDGPVAFHLKFMPYQLYPDASKDGEGKYEWYKREKYRDSEELMNKYMIIMSAYGRACEPPIEFRFGGTMANTLDAHRVIQHFQEEKGEVVARKIVDSLYSQYFENERHPSADDTLLTACKDAGLDEAASRAFIDDSQEGLQDVKMLVREQARNGIDAVPHVVFEGKRRDLTLTGAKEIAEYLKTMEQIAKEST
jgi:predicted DsbA family dithiol-disulfide isomerase